MNISFFRRGVLVLAFFAGLVGPAQASDNGTRDEAKAMTDAAIQHIKRAGAEKAFADFSNDKATWIKKDLYVSVFDTDANWVAHGTNPKLIGKNLLGLKDKNGKEMVKEMIQVAASKGEGWVDYAWLNPVTQKVEDKSSWVKRIDGTKYIVAVGVYR